MKMIIVTQCCCGCTVRTGSLIIGILCMISALLDFIYGMVLISVHDDVVHNTTEHRPANFVMSQTELVATGLFSLAMCIASGLLIYGIVKELVKLIAAWLLVYVAYGVLLCMYIMQIVIVVIIHNERVVLLWEIPALLIAFVFTAYFVIVVNSHYRNIKDGVTLPPRPPLIITV